MSPGFTKLRVNWEEKYVTDFVLAKYPDDEAKFRVPLGTAPEMFIREMGLTKALKTYRPYRPECDAAVITADRIVLIEGKIMKVMDGLAKLPIYRSLVRYTPELDVFKNLPVEAMLVTPKEPGWTREIADEYDIRIEIFVPEWIEDYYEHQERYWTAEERFKRLQRRDTLTRMGYE